MNPQSDRLLSLPPTLRILRRWEFPRKLGFCDRIYGRALGANGIRWVHTAAGPIWKLDLANRTHRWIVYGYYEGPAFWRWLRTQGSQIRTIVDSGANIGQTVIYFRTILPTARIFAYEPGTAARTWLMEGVATNNFENVTVESTALGVAPGNAHLVHAGDLHLHGSWNRVSETEGEDIAITSLDRELARHNVARLDLWKVDMEGYEFFALRGAARAIEAGRIKAIYIETSGDKGRDSLDFLRQRGYRVHGLAPSGRLVPWRPSHTHENALCLAPDRTS